MNGSDYLLTVNKCVNYLLTVNKCVNYLLTVNKSVIPSINRSDWVQVILIISVVISESRSQTKNISREITDYKQISKFQILTC